MALLLFDEASAFMMLLWADVSLVFMPVSNVTGMV